MTRLTRVCRAMGVGIAVTTATLAMTQVAHADPAPPTLPPGTGNISPLPANPVKVFLVGHAKGVQKYQCTASADNTTFTWKFVGPQADLVDDSGKLIVKHFAGPLGPTQPEWQATADQSAVYGTKQQSGTPTTPGPPGVPWLLLSTVRADGSPTTGLLVGTQFIQRVNTQGGTQPPDAECKAQTVNKEVSVPYKADYYFWNATA